MTQQFENQFSDGAAYERMMGRWSRKTGVRFLEWLGAGAGLAWLDAGCGNGAFTEEIAANASPSSITGIDLSPEQVAYARARPNLARARFEVGDVQQLPFEPGSFDAAVMALVIAFVPDPGRAIAELRRVVRPGGIVATYMWDLPGGGVPLNPIYESLRSLGFSPPMPPQAAISRAEGLEGLWAAAGLKDIAGTALRITVTYADFDDFWTSNSAPTGPQGKFIESLSAEQREALRRDLQSRLTPATDGSISYEAFANAVKGRAA